MRDKDYDFHSITLSGRTFVGSMSVDGPYISEQNKGVALGSCCSVGRDQNGDWAIFKYRDQHRLSLKGLSDDDVADLVVEFGIRLHDSRPEEWMHFFNSPAWPKCSAWINKHPRIAARFANTTHYLPGWFDRAIAEGRAVKKAA
ncbi:hypothetical protein [Rhizobium sp. BK176]|uniref:hypothetical protein n=1 Tax=Rhizobium sp. BK176 TaxID=2587071 RepID=UPI0021678054|nr:hypothetical protein [Rhizobium sp. BK176]MCS4088773.1 hypothetical protein [Rhizobium sp. BK176]